MRHILFIIISYSHVIFILFFKKQVDLFGNFYHIPVDTEKKIFVVLDSLVEQQITTIILSLSTDLLIVVSRYNVITLITQKCRFVCRETMAQNSHNKIMVNQKSNLLLYGLIIGYCNNLCV